MKVLFITTYKITDTGDGISNKIVNQVNAFRRLGAKVDFLYRNHDGVCGEIDGEKIFNKNKLLTKVLFPIWCVLKTKKKSYELIYIRNMCKEPNVISLPFALGQFSKISMNTVIEIPTYPFEGEVKSLSDCLYLKYYNFCKIFMRKHVNFITFMGEERKSIWDIPSLRRFNAVDFNSVLSNEKKEGETINFIGVAGLAYWHGYDRVIEGICSYNKTLGINKKYKLKFHIVGDYEPEFSRLKELVSNLKVTEDVVFHGRLNNTELNKLFPFMSIAIDSLGRHRSGQKYNCSIKSKEYAARNIPFIKSHKDDAFEMVDFVLTVPANDDELDMFKVIKWYESLGEYGFSIRDYARSELTWERQMSKVLNKANKA